MTRQIPHVVMVIPPRNFRDEEYLSPAQALKDAEFMVTVASLTVGHARGIFGTWVQVDSQITDINIGDYDGLIFIGGAGTATYFDNETALGLATDADKSGLVLGAICIAPTILANAGVLEGRLATADQSQLETLASKGAVVEPRGVVTDGWIVTASGPSYAKDFADAVITRLKQRVFS